MKKAEDTILLSVGSNLRNIRISQKISQNQLSYETGLSREYINKVEAGKCNISIKKLALIAEALNVSIKKFFD